MARILIGLADLLLAGLLLAQGDARADEWWLAAGAPMVTANSVDLQVNYRQRDSHLQFGYRYVRLVSESNDPFTGTRLDRLTDTITGPQLNYLFTPEESTLYVGVELLRFTRTEEALNAAVPSDTQSTTDVYFGGGLIGRFGSRFMFNLGIYVNPTMRLDTRLNNGNRTSKSGNGDGILQFGMVF